MTKRRKKNSKTPADPSVFPSNVRLTVEPDRLEVVYSRKRWEFGLFLLVFSSIWIRGLYLITEGLLRQGHEWKNSDIFGLGLFWLVALFLFFLVACCFFHRERLRIHLEGLEWRFIAIFPIRWRKITWDQLIVFQRGYGNCNTGHGVPMIRSWGCQVETTVGVFHMFLDMPPHSDGVELHGISTKPRSCHTDRSLCKRAGHRKTATR